IMTASRASGIVASALASAKQDGINYSEHVADRVLEALGAKGFVIVEKATQEPNRHWPTWADVPEGVWVRGENSSLDWEWVKSHSTAYAVDLNADVGYRSSLTSSQLDALAPFKAV
ncbi:hypothetical protein, partial [Rhodococcus sp. T9N]|uniref:hypothetical protein n=1 Tax=Rhodococcus sp. T9N TaxID=627445 RepID=UPI0021C2E96A